MKLLTIDTSVLLSVLLNERHKIEVIDMTEGFDLISPFSLDAEVGNALSAMFKRDRISLDSAKKVLNFFDIPIRRSEVRLEPALLIANRQDIYAYDAYVLDCAIQYRTPLLSLDEKMIEIAKDLDIKVQEVKR